MHTHEKHELARMGFRRHGMSREMRRSLRYALLIWLAVWAPLLYLQFLR